MLSACRIPHVTRHHFELIRRTGHRHAIACVARDTLKTWQRNLRAVVFRVGRADQPQMIRDQSPARLASQRTTTAKQRQRVFLFDLLQHIVGVDLPPAGIPRRTEGANDTCQIIGWVGAATPCRAVAVMVPSDEVVEVFHVTCTS